MNSPIVPLAFDWINAYVTSTSGPKSYAAERLRSVR